MRRLRNAILAEVVDVLCARREQLCGGENRVHFEFALEEFRVDAFSICLVRLLCDVPSTCLQNVLKLSTSSFSQDTKQSQRKRTLLLDGSFPKLSLSDLPFAIFLF